MSAISSPSAKEPWWSKPAVEISVTWTLGSARMTATLSVPIVGLSANTPAGIRRAKSSKAELSSFSARFDSVAVRPADNTMIRLDVLDVKPIMPRKGIAPYLLHCVALHPRLDKGYTSLVAYPVFESFDPRSRYELRHELPLTIIDSGDYFNVMHPNETAGEIWYRGHLAFYLGPAPIPGRWLDNPDIREAWLIEIDRLLEDPEWACAVPFLQKLLATKQPATDAKEIP